MRRQTRVKPQKEPVECRTAPVAGSRTTVSMAGPLTNSFDGSSDHPIKSWFIRSSKPHPTIQAPRQSEQPVQTFNHQPTARQAKGYGSFKGKLQPKGKHRICGGSIFTQAHIPLQLEMDETHKTILSRVSFCSFLAFPQNLAGLGRPDLSATNQFWGLVCMPHLWIYRSS